MGNDMLLVSGSFLITLTKQEAANVLDLEPNGIISSFRVEETNPTSAGTSLFYFFSPNVFQISAKIGFFAASAFSNLLKQPGT